MSLEHPTSTTTTIITRICFCPSAYATAFGLPTANRKRFCNSLNRPALLKARQRAQGVLRRGLGAVDIAIGSF